MSFIRNYVTDIKMAVVCGDVCKICMGDYGEKFLNSNISAKMEDIEL